MTASIRSFRTRTTVMRRHARRYELRTKTVLKLDDRVGLNPAIEDLHKVWEAGSLAVVHGAGYPNPNHSHSRSMEISAIGRVGPVPDAGWLGRIAELQPSLGPCYVGTEATPLAVRGRKLVTPVIAGLADYQAPTQMPAADERVPPVDELARQIDHRTDEALAQARRLQAIAGSLPNSAAGSLEERLTTIRVLIAA